MLGVLALRGALGFVGDAVEGEEGGDGGVEAEVARFVGAVEVAAALGSGVVDLAEPDFAEVWAAGVDEWEDGAVVEEDASVSGAAGALAGFAGEVQHGGRADSAAVVGVDVWAGRGVMGWSRRVLWVWAWWSGRVRVRRVMP